MADWSERAIGSICGFLGAALLIIDGLLDLVRGVVYLAIGRGIRALGPFDQAVLFIVIGIVVAAFTALGGVRRQERSIVAGAVLVVVALAGWLVLGFGSGVLALLASIFILIAGIVYLLTGR